MTWPKKSVLPGHVREWHHLSSNGFSLCLPASSWNNTWGIINSSCFYCYPTATQTDKPLLAMAKTMQAHMSSIRMTDMLSLTSHARIVHPQKLAWRTTDRNGVWTTGQLNTAMSHDRCRCFAMLLVEVLHASSIFALANQNRRCIGKNCTTNCTYNVSGFYARRDAAYLPSSIQMHCISTQCTPGAAEACSFVQTFILSLWSGMYSPASLPKWGPILAII